MSVRHEWYQTDTNVVVTVLLKNAEQKNYNVLMESDSVQVTADGYELRLELMHPINVAASTHKAYTTKIEIHLRKASGERWEALERTKVPEYTCPPTISKKNWDQLAKEAEKEEGEPVGDEAVKQLFQKIYNTSDPEVRKAMNKSYMESAGTVLSTNWKEVSEKKVDVKPPDGVEYKKW